MARRPPLKLAQASFGTGLRRFLRSEMLFKIFFSKLFRSHRKLVNCMWNRFPTGIRSPLSIYTRGSWSTERYIYPIYKKPIYLLFMFYLKLFEPPFCPAILWTRFACILSDLTDPRTPQLCVSPTGLPRRHSWVFLGEERVSNRPC